MDPQLKLLIPATILFLVGFVLAIVTAVGYSKAKNRDEENFESKPYVIKICIAFAMFLVAQILLFLNR